MQWCLCRKILVWISMSIGLAGVSCVGAGNSVDVGSKDSETVIRAVQSARVESMPPVEIRTFPGEIRTQRRVNLGFNVSGVLLELHADEGSKVKQGDLIAKLDPRDFQYRMDMAGASFLQNRLEYERQQGLFEDKVISQSDLDRIEVGYISAKAQYDAAKKALEDSEIRAPFEGIIAKRFVENFSQVNSRATVVTLYDTRVWEVVADVPENMIVTGTREDIEFIKVRFSNIPGLELDAKLSEFGIDPNPVTRTYTAIFQFPHPKVYNLMPGMSVLVEVGVKNDIPFSLCRVPTVSVITDDGEHDFVWVIPDQVGKPVKRAIKTGKLDGDWIEVIDGVVPGELVATAGVYSLNTEMQVRGVEVTIMGLYR